MTARLLYVFDPLCGWCYGFGPVLREVRRAFPDLSVDLRFGGLVTGGRIGPYAAMRNYIQTAQIRLQAATGKAPGAAFHDRIVGDNGVTASSIPPCDALLALREVAPEAVLDYTEALQEAHFGEGADLNDPRTYLQVSGSLGLDFAPDILGPAELRPALAREFAEVGRLGVSSYPTLMLTTRGRYHPVPLVYSPKGQVDALRAALVATKGATEV